MNPLAVLASAGLAAVAAALLLPAVPSAAADPSITLPSAATRDRSATGSSAARRRRALASALCALAGWYVLGGWLGVAAAPVAGLVAWRFLDRLESRAERQRRERLARSLPHTVDLLAATLVAGASPTAAIGLIAGAVDSPMSDELAGISARLALGVDPVRVWAEVGRDPQIGPLGRSLVRAIETGASVSEAMLRLAEDLRRDSRAETEQVARSVGVKAAVPLGLCLLPAFVLTGVVPLVAGSLLRLSGQ